MKILKMNVHLLILISMLMINTTLMADTVRAAVASNFISPMKEIAKIFENETGHSVQIVFGSSGKFYAQILNGAPFDVFLSADSFKPERLEHEGKTVNGSRFTYASGSLMLWSSDQNLIKDNADILHSRDFRMLAMANPRLAPYGSAAKQVLSYYGLWPRLKLKTVSGENISQTYQFVSSGNADLGFVSLSQVSYDGKLKNGSGWIVPTKLYDPIRQQAVLLASAENNLAATELMRFLKSDHALNVMKTYGYRLPVD